MLIITIDFEALLDVPATFIYWLVLFPLASLWLLFEKLQLFPIRDSEEGFA